jgi:hypothetical protein
MAPPHGLAPSTLLFRLSSSPPPHASLHDTRSLRRTGGRVLPPARVLVLTAAVRTRRSASNVSFWRRCPSRFLACAAYSVIYVRYKCFDCPQLDIVEADQFDRGELKPRAQCCALCVIVELLAERLVTNEPPKRRFQCALTHGIPLPRRTSPSRLPFVRCNLNTAPHSNKNRSSLPKLHFGVDYCWAEVSIGSIDLPNGSNAQLSHWYQLSV